MEILTKDDAIKLNSKWYFDATVCKNGHVDKRYTNTGICYTCKRMQNKRNYKNNLEINRARLKRSYSKIPKDVVRERAKKWVDKNIEKVREIKRKNKKKHLLKYRNAAKLSQREKRKDPHYRICRAVSKAVWQTIKNGKEGKSWKEILKFSAEEFFSHMESKFKDGMSWENYGSYWQVDHVKPLSWFDLSDPDQFFLAWELSNLQPLKTFDNLSKGNRFIG